MYDRDDDIQAYLDLVPPRVCEWRREYFRRQLYEITYRQFLKTREEIREISPDLFHDLGGGSNDEDDVIDSWPEYFDVENVPRLLKSELKSKPKVRSVSSVSNMLQECNIREQLDRKMEEFNSRPRSVSNSAHN